MRRTERANVNLKFGSSVVQPRHELRIAFILLLEIAVGHRNRTRIAVRLRAILDGFVGVIDGGRGRVCVAHGVTSIAPPSPMRGPRTANSRSLHGGDLV